MKNKKTLGLILFLIIVVVIIGCRKDDLAVLIDEIKINNDEDISESFFLPKYIEGSDDVVIEWESSDTRIINIVTGDNGDNYKAIVIQPDSDIEMELTATFNKGSEIYEKSFPVYVVKDQYKYVNIDQMSSLENGEFVKIDVTVIFSETNLFAVSDDTGALVFKGNHNNQVGDNLIIKLDINSDGYTINSSERIKLNSGFDPFKFIELKSILEISRVENLEKDYLYRVIGEVSRVNNDYFLKSPNNAKEFIAFDSSNIVEEYDGALVETLVLITGDINSLIKLYSTQVYQDYEYYYQDFEKVETIIDDIDDIFKGIITTDIILPTYDVYNPEIIWKMNGFDLSNGKIIHPKNDSLASLEVTVKINEAVITKIIDIRFIDEVILTFTEARDVFLFYGKSIVLIEGSVASIGDDGIILSNGSEEILVTGLVDVMINDRIYIRGEIIDINTLRLIESYSYGE